MSTTKVRLLGRLDPLSGPGWAQADEVCIASAFLSAATVRQLLAPGQAVGAQPRSITVLFGADLNTGPAPVELLYQAATENPAMIQSRFVPHRSGQLFHPKVYYRRCGARALLSIGSGNFTSAGQRGNTELYLEVECAVGSELEQQFRAIWNHWAAAPFSIPLTEEVVAQLRRRADQQRDFLRTEQQRDELREVLAAEEQLWQLVTAAAERPELTGSPVASNPREQLRSRLAAGFLFQTQLSLAQLQVPVTEELLAGDARRSREESGEAVVLDASVSAYVRLLPVAAWTEFEQLARQADRELRSLAWPTPAGNFVPASAYTSFRTSLAQLRRRHRQLMSLYLRDPAPVREHLQTRLSEEIERAWSTAYPDQQGHPPCTLTDAVRTKVEGQRRCLRAKPAEAVPFTLTRWLHPEVTRVSYPAHPMWRLEAEDPDRLLLDTVLGLLERQTEAISGVTRWQQQPARKKDYDRVSRLLFLSGKQTRRWLRLLQPGTKPPLPGTAEERRRRAQLWSRHIERVRTETAEHRKWLETLRLVSPADAFTQLSDHYQLD